MSRPRFSVLVSGRGSNLRAILRQRDALGADLAVVVANVADAPALDAGRAAGVPAVPLVPLPGEKRDAYDARLAELLAAHGVDWVVLAGWMRIVSDAFIARFPDHIVNIHPSLLPSFPGLHPHRQAIEAGVRFSGCTVHLVQPGAVDTGRILDQCVVPIYDGDTEDALAERVLREEHRLYPAVLRRLFAGHCVNC